MKPSLRALATRWLTLLAEIDTYEEALDTITMTAAPTLREAFGIVPDSAAEMMIVAGDNPTRVRSEAAFAKALRRVPGPRVERGDPPASAVPGRPSPSQCRALSDRDRPQPKKKRSLSPDETSEGTSVIPMARRRKGITAVVTGTGRQCLNDYSFRTRLRLSGRGGAVGTESAC